LAERRKVIVKDVSQVVCSNPDIKYEIENIELMNFSTSSKEQQVISSLFIIEAINKSCSDVEVINLGVPDVIVYYKAYDTSDRIKQSCKFIILCLIAFLGAGFSIISYNSDVNLVGQLDLLQNLFVGSSESGSTVAGIAYSVGLFVGIIIFFNHGLNKKFSDDPTPLQVQMRKYEQEVNQAIIVDANRKQEARDAD
jgi:stage V sporulation protein AA